MEWGPLKNVIARIWTEVRLIDLWYHSECDMRESESERRNYGRSKRNFFRFGDFIKKKNSRKKMKLKKRKKMRDSRNVLETISQPPPSFPPSPLNIMYKWCWHTVFCSPAVWIIALGCKGNLADQQATIETEHRVWRGVCRQLECCIENEENMWHNFFFE